MIMNTNCSESVNHSMAQRWPLVVLVCRGCPVKVVVVRYVRLSLPSVNLVFGQRILVFVQLVYVSLSNAICMFFTSNGNPALIGVWLTDEEYR